MSMLLETLAKNINVFLEKNFKRPAWLSEKSGVKPPNLSKILGRSGNPTLATLEMLSDAMGVHPSDLLRFYPSPEDFELVIRIRERDVAEEEVRKIQKEYESSTSERPRTHKHPNAIKKELIWAEQNLADLNAKIEMLRTELGIRQKKRELIAAKYSELSQTVNPESSERTALVNQVVASLAALDEDQLRTVRTLALRLAGKSVNVPDSDVG